MHVLITDSTVAAELVEQRRSAGVDTYDEVWEGVYRVVPAGSRRHGEAQARILSVLQHWTGPRVMRAGTLVVTGPINIGTPASYRVPDAAVLADEPDDDAVYVPTALMVVEVLSPQDDTFRKFDFYLQCGVREILVVDPQTRTIELHSSDTGAIGYTPVDDSEVLQLDDAVPQLVRAIGW